MMEMMERYKIMRISKEINQQHLKDPKLGDYWMEMFSPVAVVVYVDPRYVVTLEKTKNTDKDHWTWDVEAIPILYTRNQWLIRWNYDYINGTWCDVVPERHLWVPEFVERPLERAVLYVPRKLPSDRRIKLTLDNH